MHKPLKTWGYQAENNCVSQLKEDDGKQGGGDSSRSLLNAVRIPTICISFLISCIPFPML